MGLGLSAAAPEQTRVLWDRGWPSVRGQMARGADGRSGLRAASFHPQPSWAVVPISLVLPSQRRTLMKCGETGCGVAGL